MRWLLAVATGLFVLWSGYWVVGSRATVRAVQAWIADAPKNGFAVKTGDITLAGFPNRFDLTVTSPEYADPVSGWTWRAPFVQVLALSYKPWEVIAALPPAQTLSRPGEDIGITSDRLRASIKVFPTLEMGLDSIIVEGDAVAGASGRGWSGSVRHAVIALRNDATRMNGYQLGVQMDALTLDPAIAAALASTSDLPAIVDSVTVDVTTVLSAPLDRNSGATRPVVDSVDIKKVLIVWGPLSVFADGSLAPDAAGLAEGQIGFKITNWQHLVPVMVASGAIKPELSQTAGNMLAALAKSSSDPDVLDLPLTFKDGWMTLGPFPLGPSPALRAQAGL